MTEHRAPVRAGRLVEAVDQLGMITSSPCSRAPSASRASKVIIDVT
ncbi:MAG TPA: hypothetical protein VLK58_03085 [Conexibacter sp.]|nr:hypothetical protein [Conexibacter sp.]